MLQTLLTEFYDLAELTPAERFGIMTAKDSADEEGVIESFIRRLFVFAIVSKSSDVHIEVRGRKESPNAFINVRTPRGFTNYKYSGKAGKHFATKLFYLTGTPQGGSTASSISTRFSIELPYGYALKHGLQPKADQPYCVDLRVEYARLINGFAFTCRLLDQQRTPGLGELGLTGVLLSAIKDALEQPSGLIIAAGPTGSGKTTLLNALLMHLNNGQRSIVTIEHPVEYTLHGDGPIKQLPIDGEMSFASALRASLRHDPDVILVGEIRDEETMKIALQAGQTGHLVLSTLHANSSTAAVTRMVELGANPFVLAETLKLVMAQRLIDRIDGARKIRKVTFDESAWLKINGLGHIQEVNEVSGGKNGKFGVIEAFAMDASLRQAVRTGAVDETLLYRLAREQELFEPLVAAGLREVENGNTSLAACKQACDSNPDAENFPCKRIRLAQEDNSSLSRVSVWLDALQSMRSSAGGAIDSPQNQLEATNVE